VVFFSTSAFRSTIDTFGVGTRIATPSNFPFSSGITSATALAAQRLAQRMKDVLEADGINLINACGAAAWQTVFHFHIHVVPRYEDDPLKLPWVPAPGDSNEIAAVAAKLRGENG